MNNKPEEHNLNNTASVDESIFKRNAGIRCLFLYQLLLDYSDENHSLTTPEIIELMKEKYQISVHRVTVAKDIEALIEAGFDIIVDRRQACHYYIGERNFSLPELKLLIDAVQSSKFITEKKSAELISKLAAMAGNAESQNLQRNVHIAGRAKSDNEKGYYIVDAINTAINDGKMIAFLYFDFDGTKKRILKNDGQKYHVSPYDLIWDGDYYYLTGFCEERHEVRVFRVDRILNQPEVLPEDAVSRPSDYRVETYTQESFRMFVTQKTSVVTLRCSNGVMKNMIDQFGNEIAVEPYDEEHFSVNVPVCVGPTFFRWLFAWEGKVMLAGPEDVLNAYKDMLSEELARLTE